MKTVSLRTIPARHCNAGSALTSARGSTLPDNSVVCHMSGDVVTVNCNSYYSSHDHNVLQYQSDAVCSSWIWHVWNHYVLPAAAQLASQVLSVVRLVILGSQCNFMGTDLLLRRRYLVISCSKNPVSKGHQSYDHKI